MPEVFHLAFTTPEPEQRRPGAGRRPSNFRQCYVEIMKVTKLFTVFID